MGLYKNNNGTLELISGATLYADNPIGTILPYGGATAPLGWVLCQGQAVSRTEYAELFAVIGTAFGNGDGVNTFNLPDPRNKFLEGASTTNPIGTEKSAGLPNIKGGITGGAFCSITGISGPFTASSAGSSFYNQNGEFSRYAFNFDANKSNSIYSDSVDTVQPPAVCTNYIIKAKQVAAPADFVEAAADAGEAAAEEVVALKQNITDNSLDTTAKTVPGAINELHGNKVSKFSGTSGGYTYVTVDQLAYDQTNKTLGLKVNGADTVIPFSRSNNFSLDARNYKPIMFAMDTLRMAANAHNTGVMSVDQNYFDVVSTTIHSGTYRIVEMQIKAKKSFTLHMYGGFYNGTIGFEPLFPTSSAPVAIDEDFSIVEGTTYRWVNRRTNDIENASACCYGVVLSE